MIIIKITSDGKKIYDKMETLETTLEENAIVIRRLEEIKKTLLEMEYDNDFKIDKKGETK
jgi:hypothetical protein